MALFQGNLAQKVLDNKRNSGGFMQALRGISGFRPINYQGNFGTNQNYGGAGGFNYATTNRNMTSATPIRTTGNTQTTTAGSQSGLIRPAPSVTTTQPNPVVANATTPDRELNPGSTARAVYAAGQINPEEERLRKEAENLSGVYANKGAAPLGGFNIGGAAQDWNQAQNALLEGRLKGLGFSRDTLQTGLQRNLQGASTVFGGAAPGQISPGNTAFNPLSGENINGIGASPFAGGVAQGNVALGQNFAQMNASHQAAQGIKNQIGNLISNTTVNPSEFTDVNKALQFISGRVGNPQYQTLSNYLNEYISTLAPILGVGGDTTNLKTQIAQSMVNAQASGGNIMQVLNDLDSLAQNKLSAIAQSGQGTNYSSGSTGGSSFAEAW